MSHKIFKILKIGCSMAALFCVTSCSDYTGDSSHSSSTNNNLENSSDEGFKFRFGYNNFDEEGEYYRNKVDRMSYEQKKERKRLKKKLEKSAREQEKSAREARKVAERVRKQQVEIDQLKNQLREQKEREKDRLSPNLEKATDKSGDNFFNKNLHKHRNHKHKKIHDENKVSVGVQTDPLSQEPKLQEPEKLKKDFSVKFEKNDGWLEHDKHEHRHRHHSRKNKWNRKNRR